MRFPTDGAAPHSHLALVPAAASAPPSADDGHDVFDQLLGDDGLATAPGVTHRELVDAATHALRQLLGVDHAWFVESEGFASAVACWTEAEGGVGVGNPSVSQAVGGRVAVGALGSAPVECEGRLVGVLVVWSKAPRAWTSRDRRVLRTGAHQLSLAMTKTAPAQRSAQQLLADELASLRSELLRLLDHELRTPLSVMLGGLELLADGPLGELTDRQQVMVARLERNAERLLEMARSVTRVGDRGIDPDVWGTDDKPSADLDHVLGLAIGDLGSVAPVVTTARQSLLVELPLDELRELLDRVLSNAVKFTSAEGEIVVTTESRGSGLVEVVVQDTGCGIASDEVGRIGEPFFRSSAAREAEKQGVGLGLAAAQRIARSWGGHLHVQSELGKGTRVSILLPGSQSPVRD